MLLPLAAALGALAVHRVCAVGPLRVETLVEAGVLGVGAVAALWVGGSALLALACVVAAATGRRWTAAERAVVRVAPGVVRRLARAGVGIGVGAGLVLGGGTAWAAPGAPDATGAGTAAAGPAVVLDLGWQSTAADPATGVAPATAAESGTARSATVPGSPAAPDDLGRPATGPGTPPPGAVGTDATGTQTGTQTGPDGTPASGSTSADTAVPVDAPAPDVATAPPTTPPPAGTATPVSPGATALATGATRDTGPASEDPAPAGATVVVLRGDTLWGIAATTLGADADDASVLAEVARWHDANRDVIGADPDLLLPGQVLHAPG